jgi:hypothetical protein
MAVRALAPAWMIFLLAGCVSSGPEWRAPEPPAPGNAKVVVYRYSQVGGRAGSGVPTRLEANERVAGKLPDASFIAFEVPAGEVRLSATDMIDLRYAGEDRMTLREKLAAGEIAYFRTVSVYGAGCELLAEPVAGVAIASRTHHPRPDLARTSCFQRVPEPIALKELARLRQDE